MKRLLVDQGRSLSQLLSIHVHDKAMCCLRRERASVEKLARRHASDADGWKVALSDFYSEYCQFVSETMRVSLSVASLYAWQHFAEIEFNGIGCMTDVWSSRAEDTLVELALEVET